MRSFVALTGGFLLLSKIFVGQTSAFRELAASHEVRSGHEAYEIAKRAINAAALDAGTENGMKATKGKLGAVDDWIVLTSGGRTLVVIEAKTSKIIGIANMERRNHQYRGVGRSGRIFVTSDAQARTYLQRLADRLGVPSTAAMQKVNVRKDGTVQDGNTSGYFGCVFKDDAGQVVATLSCDIQDGVLTCYSRTVFQP